MISAEHELLQGIAQKLEISHWLCRRGRKRY